MERLIAISLMNRYIRSKEPLQPRTASRTGSPGQRQCKSCNRSGAPCKPRPVRASPLGCLVGHRLWCLGLLLMLLLPALLKLAVWMGHV